MARGITVAKPRMFPACCISCGTIELSGRWFVDLGIDIDEKFDAMPDGVVYLCSVCVKEHIRILMQIVEEQEMGLDRVRFDRNRTDPLFDEYREILDGIESAADSDDSDDSETEKRPSGLSATFGG
jgi:hypothetical protein